LEKSNIHAVIFASGSGSNFENLVNYQREKKHFSISCLITDQENSGVIERAGRLNVPCHVISVNGKIGNLSERKKDHEQRILKKLEEYNVNWVFLAGYMRIFSSFFLERWKEKDRDRCRVINIHPSLLPDFPGRDGYGDAFNAQVVESGVTIHYVDDGVDTGPILLQEKFYREPDDSLERFKERGMKVEYSLYRKAIDLLVREQGEVM